MGKEVEYIGIIGIRSKNDTKLCLESVEYDGKLYTDHIWTNNIPEVKNMEKGAKVKFKGVAYTYKDSQNIRKNGLKRIHGYVKYNELIEREMKNIFELKKRKRK